MAVEAPLVAVKSDAFGLREDFSEAGYLDTGGVRRNERLETCVEVPEPTPDITRVARGTPSVGHADRVDRVERGSAGTQASRTSADVRRRMMISVTDTKKRGCMTGGSVRREHSCDKRTREKQVQISSGKKDVKPRAASSAKSSRSHCSTFTEENFLPAPEPDNDEGSDWGSDLESELDFGSPIPDHNDHLESLADGDNACAPVMFSRKPTALDQMFPLSRREKETANEPTAHVYLKSCKLLGQTPSAHLLGALVQSEMTLRFQVLGAKGIKACAIALVNNTKVQKLDLTGNDMQDLGCEYIAETMSANFYITHLILAENNISSVGLHCLTEVLTDNNIIRHLDISNNKFHESDAECIAHLLTNNTSLRSLNVSRNCFGGHIIGPALGENNTLHDIDLSWNSVRKRGAIAVVDGIRTNQSLKVAQLGWNGLGMEGAVALCNLLIDNQELVYLDITNNRITAEDLMFLLRGLRKNSTLKYLKMGHNPISTEGANLMLDTLKRFDSIAIKELDLMGQSVDEGFVEKLDDLKKKRLGLRVSYGVVLRQKDVALDADGDFLNEDPMMILMEFMRQKNMRLVDLFQKLDTDGSKSLSYDEFREGLLSVNIPMSEASVNKLLQQLDSDGDGEVDFAELMDGQKDYRRKLTILQKKERDMGMDGDDLQESELGRISRKVQQLLRVKEAMRKVQDSGEGDPLADTADEQALRKMGKKVLAMNRDKRRESGVGPSVAEALAGINLTAKTLSRLHMPYQEQFTEVSDILEMAALHSAGKR